MDIPVFRPLIQRSDMMAVLTCLVSEKLGPGTEADQLVCRLLKESKYIAGVLLRERLRAVEIALKCLNLPPGARVALCPLSPLSYRHAIEMLSFKPVYVDSMGDIPVMNIELLSHIHHAEPVHAVVLDHYFGFVSNMELLTRQKVPVIQDISHISIADSADILSGELYIMSFEMENIITTGGGVFLATRHKKSRFKQCLDSYPADIFLADMNAALGKIQAIEIERISELRRKILDSFQNIPSSHRLLLHESRSCHSHLPIMLNSPMADIVKYGLTHGVEILPAFAQSIIRRMLNSLISNADKSPALLYPESTKFALRTVLLPFYPGLRKWELETVQRLIKSLP